MRNVTKRFVLAVAVLGLTVGAAGQARAGLMIDFEDAVPESSFYVQQGYKGFQWGGGFGTGSWELVTPTGGLNEFSAHSGTNYAWSNSGTSLTMSDGVFDFNSLWVMSGQAAGTDTAHGFLNGTEVFTQQFAVGTSYSQVTLNFTGIDAIRFDATLFNLVVDDINVNMTVATPEPSTLASAGIGVLAMLGVAWRKRRRAAV